MEETVSYLAGPGWYDIDSAKAFNLLSATDLLQSTPRAHVLRLEIIEHKAIILPVS
jgi:hypothetical protein